MTSFVLSVIYVLDTRSIDFVPTFPRDKLYVNVFKWEFRGVSCQKELPTVI